MNLVILARADPTTSAELEALFSVSGNVVQTVHSFEDARAVLRAVIPDLLVADIRLGAYNGLHLAILERATHPGVSVMVTSRTPDLVLEREALRLGIPFFVKPLENADFMRQVRSQAWVAGSSPEKLRRWPRKQLDRTLSAYAACAGAQVANLSYGGLRLAFDQSPELPPRFDLVVPAAGMTLRAHGVWSTISSEKSETWYGVEITEETPTGLAGWRNFVDSIQ